MKGDIVEPPYTRGQITMTEPMTPDQADNLDPALEQNTSFDPVGQAPRAPLRELRVQSNENVTEGVSFYHLITSPESRASSFRSVVVYNG